jgi:hypothetical protein
MFLFHRGKTQRIPVLWIPSANRTIRVASVAHREIYPDFGRHKSGFTPADGLDRLLFWEDGILLKEE